MIIRMLRAGAGTWPVARPKRADKIMRRIKRILRTFGEKVEGFFGRLKNEFFYHRDWSGVAVESFMELLDEYIRFYNERRKKQSLGWMSPMQYRISKGLAA